MFAKNCLPLLYTMRQYPTRNQPYLRAYYQTKKATIWSKIWHLCRPHSARSSMGWCSETGTPMVLECTMDIHKFLPDRAILASKWAYRYQEEYCLSVSLINWRLMEWSTMLWKTAIQLWVETWLHLQMITIVTISFVNKICHTMVKHYNVEIILFVNLKLRNMNSSLFFDFSLGFRF